MVTSRSLARCLLLLSINAVLVASVSAGEGPNVALAPPSPAPVIIGRAEPILPVGGGKNPDTTAAATTPNASGNNDTTSPNAAPGPPPTTSSNTNPSTDTAKSAPSTSVTSADPNSTTGAANTNPASDTGSPTTSNTVSTSSPPPATSVTPPPATTAPPATTDTSPSLTPSVTTGTDGVVETVMETVLETASSTSTSSSPTSSASSGADNTNTKTSSGISTSTIIGLSVSGGVALIGLITFIIWKFTRKRSLDDDFDSEAIKWPELNTHGSDSSGPAVLPAARAAAFETTSQVNLTRPDSRAGSIATSAAASTADLYAQRDPYAVPPLPHLNPNAPYHDEPYRDDPSRAYYETYQDNDPYAPKPEAYQMSQMRSRSPGPQMTLGRASPGPQMTLGADYRTLSPAPAPSMYSGRVSPAPQAGRMSPGPQAAYNPVGGY